MPSFYCPTMKLPETLLKFLKKKDDGKEYFFSLYLDTDAAAVAVWYVKRGSAPHIASFAHGAVGTDSWEVRIQVVDRLLSAAEDKVGVDKPVAKTVFGLPPEYLTPEGNIQDSIRPHLKKLTRLLELTPVGFVPLTQALAFSFKKDEGVPPSIILINGSKYRSSVTIFRVGKLISSDAVDFGDDPSAVLEKVLKKHQDGDVLPSRILLYGGNTKILEDIHAKLLKHPWPNRVNFLHFPKISLISLEALLHAVSLAGSAELSSDMGDSEDAAGSSSAVAQPSSIHASVAEQESSREDAGSQKDVPDDSDEIEEDAQVSEATDETDAEDDTQKESLDMPEASALPEEDGTDTSNEDIANVKVVTPESLGFQKRDVLEYDGSMPGTERQPVRTIHREELEAAVMDNDDEYADASPGKTRLPAFSIPPVFLRMFASVKSRMSAVRLPRRGTMPVILGLAAIIVFGGLAFYFMPRVTVTVLVSPQSVEESATVTVDKEAHVADPANKIIPGRVLEKSVSGEKTIAVTGKKNIGDPAKGTVTIYNKVTSPKTFSKGTVLTANSISFTLDDDVSIASASESIGSITFGKGTAEVTAKSIGPNGNVSAGTEFSFAGISGSQASARNDAALTGGTSKQVTVVSRADQDGLVKSLTSDLIEQAKTQLLDSSFGGDRLINETITAKVSDASFDREIDEEASKLHGKVTVVVSGLSMRDDDVKAILTSLVSEKVPAGYALSPDQSAVAASKVTVKKDGTITLTATLTAAALPTVDVVGLTRKLAGTDVKTALAILKQGVGVAGAEFRFSLSPTKGRLPLNSGNITITVAVR